MENYDTYKQAISEAKKAEGTAARKMQAYNESVAYSINQLSAAWEGFTQKLEASGAVKLFFDGLTAVIENLDHILQGLIPLIATFNADKIVSLAKFLSPLVTFIPKSVMRGASNLKAGKKVSSGFYENMTQKMTAENTNAIEGLTNAIRDNTAALRGEKPKSGSSGTGHQSAFVGKNTRGNKNKSQSNTPAVPMNGIPGVDQYTPEQIDLKVQSYDSAISYAKQSGTDEKIVKQLENKKQRLLEIKSKMTSVVPYDPNIQKAEEEKQAELEAQKKLNRSARLKTGIASGLSAGAVRFANKGSSSIDDVGIFKGTGDVEISDGEAAAMGGVQAVLTAGLTAWLGPVGTVLASVGGDLLSSLWKKLAHADEIARKERVEQAKENLEAIKGISTSVTGLIDLQSKIMVNGKADTSLWDADDWKQANEYVDSLKKTADASDGFRAAIAKVDNSLSNLSFTIEGLIENQETLAKIEAARIAYEAEQTYAAGEQDRYTLLKEIEEAQKTLISGKASDEDKESARAKITANKAAIQEYTSELNKAYMKSAFYSSGVSTMSEGEINVASLDRLLIEMAAEAQKRAEETTGEKFFEDDGTLKSEYRSSLIQDLRERGGYGAVLTDSKKSISDYNDAMELANEITGKTGKSLSELKDAANTVNEDGAIKIIKTLTEAGYGDSEIESIIDAINNADANKVASIANSFNMTAEQFAKANENRDFDFVTTGMALENLDAFTERVNTLNDALAELAVNGKLSSDSLKNIIQNYSFLLQGDDDFSADNILKNLADLYAQGADSPIAQLLAGKFQSEATTSETWWKAWTQSDIGKQFIEEKPTNTTFKSFAEAMEEMSGEQKESYINYVASLYETDFMEDVRQKLIEWQTKSYENEISNLESIRDSLDDVNKQREKEIELIKAKEALENAYAEKKRVYRAGVGFVYSTDQEAVKTAQEKVDELERQKDKDTIQYQIDSLQQQKEILESIEENEQLQNLEEYVKTISGAFGKGGTLFNSILGQNRETFMENMTAAIASGIEENAENVKKEENLRATEAAAEAYMDAGTNYDNFMTKENQSILNDKNNPRYAAIYKQWLEKVQALENARNAYTDASGLQDLDEKWSYKDKKASAFESWNSVNSTNYGEGSLNTKVNGLLDNSFDWNQFVKATGAASTAGFIFSGGNPLAALLAGGAAAVASAASQIGKATVGADIYIDDDTAPKAEGEEFSKHMIEDDPHIIIHYDTEESDPNKKWKYYRATKSLAELQKVMTPGDILINDSYWGQDHAVYLAEDGTFRWVNSSSGRIYKNDWEKALDPTTDSSKYASGVISSAGGPALINENGLESIITPQGTITSLPSKTGIIPADLTRNLWALGEVAPNLIARLGGNGVQTSNNSSSTDNSININNLDAKFYTEEGFDGEAFLRELKKQVILTANNH